MWLPKNSRESQLLTVGNLEEHTDMVRPRGGLCWPWVEAATSYQGLVKVACPLCR